MFLSILSPPLPPLRRTAIAQTMAGMEHPWELRSDDPVSLHASWQEARGTWLLFLNEDGGIPEPDVWRGAEHFDVLGLTPDVPLRPPFALRRSLLEAVGGLQRLPTPSRWIDLTLRLEDAGARCASWPSFPPPPQPPLDRMGLLALFSRQPHRKALQWALGQPSSALEALEAAHQEAFGHPVPAQCRFSSHDLAAYFAEQTTPPLQSPKVLEAALDALADAGAWVSGEKPEVRFDKSHAMNLLLSRTPLKQAVLQRNPLLRFPPPALAGSDASHPAAIEVDGIYTVALTDAVLAEGAGGSLSLPLPVEGPHQSITLLQPVHPPEVGMEWQPGAGTLRFTLPAVPSPSLRLGYVFRARIQEGVPTPDPAPSTAPLPPVAPAFRAPLEAMLKAIFPGPPPTEPLERAQRIYAWIVEHIPYLLSERLGLFALEARGGNCQHRVRLFALLAAKVGLRVRERAGILAGSIAETGTTDGQPWARCVLSERGHTPQHVWGEVWLPGSGWVPFDFLGTDSGARQTNHRSVPEPALRDHLRAWTPRLEAYSFGRLDPYRVHLAEVPRPFMGVPTGPGADDLQTLCQRAWGTRHQLELTLRGLPPEVPLP